MIKDKKKAFKIFTLVNLVSFCIYLILGGVIKHFNLEFIDWVNTIAAVNMIIILNYGIDWIRLNINCKHEDFMMTSISLIVILISICIGLSRLWMYTPEHIVHKNGKTLVITVSSFLSNTCVTIYESKFLILKKEIGNGGTFDGAYDPFENGEVEY